MQMGQLVCISTQNVFHIIIFCLDKAPPQFQFTASVTNATEEDPLVLRCVVDYIYEAIAINKDGITISKSFNKTNNTITLTHSIPSLKVSDSAEYVCVARLRRGGEKKKSLLITVKGKFL